MQLVIQFSCMVPVLMILLCYIAYSLSVLMYAVPVMSLNNRQIDELNVCWNNVIRRIFCYNKWESVKAVLFGLGRFNVKHLIMHRQSKLYKRMYFSKVSFVHNLMFICYTAASICSGRCFVSRVILLILFGQSLYCMCTCNHFLSVLHCFVCHYYYSLSVCLFATRPIGVINVFIKMK